MLIINLQCVYDDVESACKRCLNKGLECGPKVSARLWKLEQNSSQFLIRNSQRSKFNFSQNDQIVSMEHWVQPQIPLHEPVDSFESMHIQFLRENEGLFRFANLQFLRTDGHRLWEIVFRRFGASLSGPVRYGYILYSFYKNKNGVYDDHCLASHLNQFYRSTNDAINQNDIASLVYGCFAGCMYSIRAGCDFQEVQIHARGFLSSISQFLASNFIEDEEIFLLECMMEKLLWVGAQRFFFDANWLTSDLAQVTEFLGNLFMPGRLKGEEPLWMQESSSEVNLKSKFVVTLVQVYRHRLRFNDSEKVKESLVSRFSRDFVTPIEIRFRDPASCDNIAHIRSLSRALWSRLLDIVSDLVCKSTSDKTFDQSTVTTILAIHSIIDIITEPQDINEVTAELMNLLDVASYCMVLIPVMLNTNKLSAESQIGFSGLISMLIN